MGENTGISWADHTFNPWIGCTKVSPACDNCYAEAWDRRWGNGWGSYNRRRTAPSTWNDVRKWNRAAAGAALRPIVFCSSLSDVFDNSTAITSGWHGDLWHLIHECQNLIFALLTKRPQNIKKMMPEEYGTPTWGDGWHNVWLGTTVENQKEADRRLPHLLDIPAALHFVSAEPLLERVDFSRYLLPMGGAGSCVDIDGNWWHAPGSCSNCRDSIRWMIAGGESGPGARLMHPDWVRDLKDQCARRYVPFHFKQWGDWLPWSPAADAPFWRSQNGQYVDGHWLFPEDIDNDPNWDDGLNYVAQGQPHSAFQKVGKVTAGRLLDGELYDEFPLARENNK